MWAIATELLANLGLFSLSCGLLGTSRLFWVNVVSSSTIPGEVYSLFLTNQLKWESIREFKEPSRERWKACVNYWWCFSYWWCESIFRADRLFKQYRWLIQPHYQLFLITVGDLWVTRVALLKHCWSNLILHFYNWLTDGQLQCIGNINDNFLYIWYHDMIIYNSHIVDVTIESEACLVLIVLIYCSDGRTEGA